MFTIQISGSKVSRDELSDAIYNHESDYFIETQDILLDTFRYLRDKFGSKFLRLEGDTLYFDCAYAEIIPDEN